MILRSVAVVVVGLTVALRSLAAARPIYQPRLRFRLRLQSDSRWPAHRPLPAALRPEPAGSHQDTASNHSQAGTTSTAMPSTDNASR